MNYLVNFILIAPLFISLTLIIRGYIKKSDSMFYTKIVGFMFGVFDLFFLMMINTDSGDDNIIYGFAFFFFVIPANFLAFSICVIVDLIQVSDSQNDEEKEEEKKSGSNGRTSQGIGS